MTCPTETQLQAFVEGSLSETHIEHLTVHLDECGNCRRLVALVQPIPLHEGRSVNTIGRYVLRREIGRGGMGVVYEGADPELHRVVALKVLLSADIREQERLLAEARAMALLSHPNVVTVHDVGRAEGRVFVVMELVEGVSLRALLARLHCTKAEILDILEQAGDGLAQAHARGLVHRDFKPENVLVRPDGRVVVADFGLAAPSASSTGEVAGSLGYMAPEQRRGEAVDARADQYSFGVTLREALLSASIAKPINGRSIERVVLRAMSERAEERYSSMTEMLVALREARRSRSPTRYLVGMVALAAVAFVTAGTLVRRENGPTTQACASLEADLSNAWNGQAEARIYAALAATEGPLAHDAVGLIRKRLDVRTSEIQAAKQRVCVRADQDPQGLVKVACLRERTELVAAVVRGLEAVDRRSIDKVGALLELIPGAGPCEDGQALTSTPILPSPAKEEGVRTARQKAATASAAIAAGKYVEGLAAADAARGLAEATGYQPVICEAYYWRGVAHGRQGHLDDAQRDLERAAATASISHSMEVAARSWVALEHFIGFEGKRHEEGERYADYARFALESIPTLYEVEVERLSWLRAMLVERRRYDQALDVSQKELALAELRLGKSHRLRAVALDGRAAVLSGQCMAFTAIEFQTQACAIVESEAGPSHPQLAICLGNLAALRAQMGDHRNALVLKRRAIDILEQSSVDPTHLARARRNLVRTLIELGELRQAREELEQAARTSVRASEVTTVLGLRGDLALRQGQAAEARTLYEQAVVRLEGADPTQRIEPLTALAQSELANNRSHRAREFASKALALASSAYGPSSCRVADPSRIVAESYIAERQPGKAFPFAERALAIWQMAEPDPLVLARAQAATALASARGPNDDRVKALAVEARQVAANSDGRAPDLVARLDDWLSRRAAK
jgi:tetratricopeptide (TPR) repeat protein